MAKKENKKSFEISISELENLVSKMESGNGSLEENMKWFDEGIKLINSCRKELEDSEKKVQELIKNNDNEFVLKDIK